MNMESKDKLWLFFLTCVTCLNVICAYESGFYADNAFTRRTELRDKLSQASRRAIKQELLNLLGLDHRPKPSLHGKHNSAPSYMLDLYRTLQSDVIMDDEVDNQWMYRIKQNIIQRNLTLPGMEDTAEKADIIMSFVNNVRHHERLRHQGNHGRRAFYFDLSQVSSEDLLTGAELRIFKHLPDVALSNETFILNIYNVVPGKNEGDHLLELESNQTLDNYQEGWIDVNVTNAVHHWIWYPSNNMGLVMEILTKNGEAVNPSEVGFVGHRGSRDKQSFMVAFFADQEVHIRKARDTADRLAETRNQQTEQEPDEEQEEVVTPVLPPTTPVTEPPDPDYGGFFADEGYNRRACQRLALYVSFKELGWQEWIIAPEGYPAFYCQGECSFPLNVHMNATNHAIVQTLVHLMNPFMVPEPNCAPTKLSANQVLYFDDNSNVILRKYRNMVVRACGCQ